MKIQPRKLLKKKRKTRLLGRVFYALRFCLTPMYRYAGSYHRTCIRQLFLYGNEWLVSSAPEEVCVIRKLKYPTAEMCRAQHNLRIHRKK